MKSQELAYHDPRGKVNVGIGYAVSETGADHLVSIHDTALQNPESVSFKAATKLGIKNALPARLLNEEKVSMYYICEKWLSVGKVLGLCYFGPAPRSFIQPEEVVEAVRAATGWDVDIDELLEIGDRAINLARLFNVREGFRRSDDTLPARLFTPSESGALAGVAYPEEDFHNAITALYRLKGWELDTGIPTKQRLEELGIGWAADLIGND